MSFLQSYDNGFNKTIIKHLHINCVLCLLHGHTNSYCYLSTYRLKIIFRCPTTKIGSLNFSDDRSIAVYCQLKSSEQVGYCSRHEEAYHALQCSDLTGVTATGLNLRSFQACLTDLLIIKSYILSHGWHIPICAPSLKINQDLPERGV